MREILAPSVGIVSIWGIAYGLIVATWIGFYSARLKELVNRIRFEDTALWRELRSPEIWQHICETGRNARLRKLHSDPEYAGRCNKHLVDHIRRLRRRIDTGLVILVLSGCFVLYLNWPIRH